MQHDSTSALVQHNCERNKFDGIIPNLILDLRSKAPRPWERQGPTRTLTRTPQGLEKTVRGLLGPVQQSVVNIL